MEYHFAGAKSQGATAEELGQAIAEAMFVRAADCQRRFVNPVLPN